ncbi:SDR family oxidoreductase [Actinomadura sp. NPDC048032]|uniref:SDR family NAD(P)-dependent oxidoreductase n=1 Tax=Actinomadura sp. NPDC048032 TaxID=3155747 RepID=UPI0033D9D974
MRAAGIEPPQDLAEIDAASWDRTQAVNLRGPALIAKAALPWWTRRRSGSLVNNGSRTWLGGGHPDYAASKAGLVGLSRSLALELAPIGVRSNAVAFLVSDQAARITGLVLHVCACSQLPLFLT